MVLLVSWKLRCGSGEIVHVTSSEVRELAGYPAKAAVNILVQGPVLFPARKGSIWKLLLFLTIPELLDIESYTAII